MALPLGAIQVVVVSLLIFPFSIISLVLRLWSKRIQKSPYAFHDYMAIVAIVLTAGAVSVFLAAAFAAGLGVHLQALLTTNPEKFALHLKVFVPAQLLWAAANTSVKFSILSLYTVIFPNRRFSYVCYGTMAVTGAYFTMVVLEGFLLCRPVQYNWDKSIAGDCKGENPAYLVAGITNLIIDAFIVTLPMPMLLGLQMSLSKKLKVTAMFSLGALICIFSLLRVLWLQSWDLADMTYTVAPGAIYSVLEPSLGVVNANLPAIMPAVHMLLGLRRNGGGSKGSTRINKGLYISHDNKLPSSIKGAMQDRPDGFECLNDNVPLTVISAGDARERCGLGGDLDEERSIAISCGWTVDRSL
ncbi:hypothetical protein B0O99DRAFT_736691 [Bisporella sp. PMI_857]|nr:hypothetical protein B0O99DRAFT_736691 [Bisporella sp. PMI_857]